MEKPIMSWEWKSSKSLIHNTFTSLLSGACCVFCNEKTEFFCSSPFFVVLRTLPWVEHVLALRRSCLPCTTLPYNHTVAWPRGSRHSMCHAYSSEWGLFGRNTRSAFRRTPSRIMQHILQSARNYLQKRFTPYHPLFIISFSSELEWVTNSEWDR